MSVILVEELPLTKAKINRLYQRTYTRVFRVTCNSRDDDARVVAAATGLPRVGNSYSRGTSVDLRSFVGEVDYELEQLTNIRGVLGCTWLVTVQYSPYDSSLFGPNPLEWPLRVSLGSTEFDKPVWKDINDDPVVNSAGQRFGDPVLMDDSRNLLKIIRNESNFKASNIDKYKDVINSDEFLTHPPFSVKARPITAEALYSSEIGYYSEVTYTFQFDSKKWKKIILDEGYATFDGSRLQQVLDGKGQPVSEPVLLDGSGGQLPDGDMPVYLEFDIYDEINFSDFGFDFTNVPGFVVA
jgi:hypothetical protein